MVKVTVCIGSSCHIKGSKQIVESLETMIHRHGVQDEVDLSGTFCMGKCTEGVSVMVDEVLYSVTPASVEAFFQTKILEKINKGDI
ncbi:MAG: (2Fe-2S) ferredoxin domain-containing protein [Ruminococcaceae bacterium]|nr:(2Fe-2S) ferredoxin domain-containing protein [Oscillospiraceae bacterium]